MLPTARPSSAPPPLASNQRRVVLLGATGSIGRSTLEVMRRHPDKLRLVGASAHAQDERLRDICREFAVPHRCLSGAGGVEALVELASLPEADTVVVATSGIAGLYPTLAALRAGKTVVLANKEAIVVGGRWVMEAARNHGGRLLPADSEHNALFQCLLAVSDPSEIQRLVLTASGGPFREWTPEQLERVTPADARKHPVWDMGLKVTIDSSTLANKGLEMIEAAWLFDLPAERIDVVIHPQSIVHGMVELRDGSLLAHCFPPDMVIPLQHCLLYPDRATTAPTRLPLEALSLQFQAPDEARFPCLTLARQALAAGGTAPIVFNAANEAAVSRFVDMRLAFARIPVVIDEALSRYAGAVADSLEEAMALHERVRQSSLS